MATVPIFRRSSGPGSSLSLSCSTSRIRRSLPSARLTVSIDTPACTASGCSVSGNATVLRSGRTGSSVGSGGGVGSAILAILGPPDGWSAQCISGSMYATSVDERQFFTEKPEERKASLSVPAVPAHQRVLGPVDPPDQEGSAAPGSDERARAMFNKVKDYLVRVDEHITVQGLPQAVRNPVAPQHRVPRRARRFAEGRLRRIGQVGQGRGRLGPQARLSRSPESPSIAPPADTRT